MEARVESMADEAEDEAEDDSADSSLARSCNVFSVKKLSNVCRFSKAMGQTKTYVNRDDEKNVKRTLILLRQC